MTSQPPFLATHIDAGAAANRGHARVLLVDDSLVARAIIGRAIDESGVAKVEAHAINGVQALAALDRQTFDIIVLDLEMPQMDGLAALPDLLVRAPNAAVLMVSSVTRAGATATIEALRLGAADTLAKPGSGWAGDARQFRRDLIAKITAISLGLRIEAPAAAPMAGPARPLRAIASVIPECIAIASSTGGPKALFGLLATLPPSVRQPILVTQHLPAPFVPVFADNIRRGGGRPAVVAEEGMEVLPGRVYVAPGQAHAVPVRHGGKVLIRLDHHSVSSGCLPSADPMFAGLADVYGSAGLAVVLTGMGRDGAEGAAKLVTAGGTVLAQDCASSVVWGMPGMVARAGLAAALQPPEELGRTIGRIVAGMPT